MPKSVAKTYDEVCAEVREYFRPLVDKGIEFLNADRADWLDRADPETLNINSCGDCVAGQVYRSYGAFLVSKGWDQAGAKAHGFDFPTRDEYTAQTGNRVGFGIISRVLSEMWREDIYKLKEGK